MDSPKYLIIITLIDGQNFAVPNGAPERIDANVFAEARFGNESILKSDPIKLVNSNPEFVTELAWQLDKRSLHQLRVERRAIKLQVFMQTREKKRVVRQSDDHAAKNGFQSDDQSSSTHKIELIGYTILDIRSAQERDQPKFQWVPLLNPKFKKSSYNRPEVQLALTLSRIDEDTDPAEPHMLPSTSSDSKKRMTDCLDQCPETQTPDTDSINSSKFYKTCLDFTLNPAEVEQDEILENDINIISNDGCFYIYDTRSSSKSTINDCDEEFRITITIPFNSDLDSLILEPSDRYYFSVSLFGASLKTSFFDELTSVETKEVHFIVFTTHSKVLTTYFELNSNLVIKLHDGLGESLGIATIQLDQLCSLDTKRRSIEGIFALQSTFDHDIPTTIHPSIGVSVVLEKICSEDELIEPPRQQLKLTSDEHVEMARQHFGEDIDDYLNKTLNDTHQLTLEDTRLDSGVASNINRHHHHHDNDETIRREDHHFCFTIDLKNFSYTTRQRLIPTLRELVVRYSYPFFGYKDTITTDASIPISQTNSIIVSGFCEFNFATTVDSLLNALREIPLDLEILTCEQSKRIEPVIDHAERVVATCSLNLAQVMCLCEKSVNQLQEKTASKTVSAPIHELNGNEIGQLQVYLCLRDLGYPSRDLKSSVGNQTCAEVEEEEPIVPPEALVLETKRLDEFLLQAKDSIENWKNDYSQKLAEEARKRENERFKRLYQRFEVKETKREQEFRKKIEELNSLEKKLRNSVASVESLEKRLSNAFEQLKTKDAMFDTRLELLDLKISKAVNDIKLEDRRNNPADKFHRLPDDTRIDTRTITRVTSKPVAEVNQLRRSSLKISNNAPGIPLPVRSSSLVRRPIEGSSTRLVNRPTNVTTTVVNGISARSRSNSTRINLSKETQEKLASLRREKAELLKRGCRPNDELIQEINSLIDKLAC